MFVFLIFDPGCRKMLEKSLFFVGEIGGNDYNVPFLEGRSMNELTALVPGVVQSITNAIKVSFFPLFIWYVFNSFKIRKFPW